jgi:hypothetical protein
VRHQGLQDRRLIVGLLRDRLLGATQGGTRSMATNAYCVKCKAKRDMSGEKRITMKNGKPATEGTCPVCGTKMFKIGG